MEKTNYTVIEPGFEFIEPPGSDNYLEFLEMCTRTCYKSEDRIKPGSAEKLMTKVVKEYEHYSVTEHCNVMIRVYDKEQADRLSYMIPKMNSLMRLSWTYGTKENCLNVSGNIRMWIDLLTQSMVMSQLIWGQLETTLNQRFPFFFDKRFSQPDFLTLVDENPLTNTDLETWEKEKHLTFTCKIIGDRSMSHQLVRHRLFAFSQESQRYCNYGKKGFQLVVPPSVIEQKCASDFIDSALKSYKEYLYLIEHKVKPEDARGLLPNCCKTEVVTTGTLGYWKHVFHHRAHNPKAQWQIREIMLGIEKKFKEILPEIF